MPNPYSQYAKPNPYAVYKTAPAGPKPPTGFAAPGSAPAVSYIPGSDKDPAYAARMAAAEAAARANASTPIETAAQMRLIQARAATELATERAKAKIAPSVGQQFDNIAQMRKELESQNSVKVYKNALPSYASALKSPATPAGDQDMIYAFAKIMDPNSVVREGEANSVADLGTVGQKIAGELQKQLGDGGKFTDELRAQLRNTLANRVGEYNKAYNFERARFHDLSTKQGIDPDLVVGPHMGDAYANIENEYFRHDPNKSAAAARAEAAAPKYRGGGGGGTPATGATITVNDPQAGAAIDALVRNGGSLDQVNAVIKSLGPDQTPITPEQFATAQQLVAKGYKGPLSTIQREQGNPLFNRAASSPIGVGVGAAVDAGMAGLSDEATGLIQKPFSSKSLAQLVAEADAKKQGAFAADPKASLIGNVVGAGTSMLGGGAIAEAARVPGLTRMFAGKAAQKALPAIGDMAYGAAYGAGDNNDNRLIGAGVGAAGGLAGNVIGGKVAKLAGGTLRGVKSAAVDYLDAAGVPMTGGQMLGGTWKAIEDKLTSIPFVGDTIKNRRAEGYNAFNQAAFNEAGRPVGANTGGSIGQMGLTRLDDATGKAYSDALDGVTLNGNDPAFLADMQGVRAKGIKLPGQMADNADYTLRTRVGDSFDPTGGLTGNNFQQSLRGLRRDARSVADQPYGYDFGQVTQGAEDALHGLADRQAPGVVPALQNANSAYRNQMVIEDAIKAGKNQIGEDGNAIFTPAQLNAASVRNGGMFAGRPFRQLAEAGQQVLPSKIPDSGTAGRAAIGLLAATAGGGAIGGGGGAAVGEADKGGGVGASLGLMAGLLNTRAGQKALTTMLLRRPQVAEDAGNWLVQQSPLSGHLGASFAGPFASSRVTPWLAR